MIDFNTYSDLLSFQTSSIAKAHLKESDMIMESTWESDPQTKLCYIYDYFHDDTSQSSKNIGIIHDEQTNKTPISCKYVVSKYIALDKDQVEYHLEFKPSQECPLDYFSEYTDKYGIEFPIGLYIDIPDEKGIYRKWLICSKDLDLQFVTYLIVPCNYYFHWIKDGQKIKMWGVDRLRNSYNSGVWVNYRTATVENQKQIWLPTNNISDTLDYDDRIIISSRRKVPLCWSVSKIENTYPLGVNKYTVGQSKFDVKKDILPDPYETVFEMYAFNQTQELDNTIPSSTTEDWSSISYSGSGNIYIGGNGILLSVKFFDKNGVEINNRYITSINDWTFSINNINLTDNEISVEPISSGDYSSITIKFIGDEDYMNKTLSCSVCDDESLCPSSIDLIVRSM